MFQSERTLVVRGSMNNSTDISARFLREALKLARRGYGATSPNPMVGALLVKRDEIIGRGWHRRAGRAHAEIEAIRDAEKHGHSTRGAMLYVTLEPCCTHGRTPPCTDAIIASGIKHVVIGARDSNPQHSGKGVSILKRAGIATELFRAPPDEIGNRQSAIGSLSAELVQLSEAFNHWIVQRTPFVTVKAAMTLDGKIATVTGDSKWITGEKARAYGMKLRQGADAILVGINTVLADDPGLLVRASTRDPEKVTKQIRRIVLDSMARTPLNARVVSDEYAACTTVVVSDLAPKKRVAALAERATVLVSPPPKSAIGNRQSAVSLPWLLQKLGAENVTSLLVEGGGEANASFLGQRLAHRVAFFYAPKIVGGRDAHKAVAGNGINSLSNAIQLHQVEWRWLGPDLLLTGRIVR